MLRNLDDCFFSLLPPLILFHTLSPSSQFQNISLTPVLWCTHGGHVAHPGAPDLCSAANSVNGTAAHTSKSHHSVHSDRAPHSHPSFLQPPNLLRLCAPTHQSAEDLVVSASSHRQAAQLFHQIDPRRGREDWVEREFTATTTTFKGGLATSSSFLCKEGLPLCGREEGESVSLLFPALSLTVIQLFRDKASTRIWFTHTEFILDVRLERPCNAIKPY